MKRKWIIATVISHLINLARTYFVRVLMSFGAIVLDIQLNKIQLKIGKISLVLRMRKNSFIIFVKWF